MTVLITGGSGLVGSHVIEALRRAAVPMRALVRPGAEPVVRALGAEPVTGDVIDPETWRRAAAGGLSGIVHAAAIVGPGGATYHAYEAVNVGGSRLAVETARATGAYLVHVSSVSVYSGSADYQPKAERRTEDTTFQPLAPDDHYARSKRESEQLIREAAQTGAIGATAIRPDVIYGERDRLFAPRIHRSIRTRILPLVGPGTNHLPCVYAGNVASAIVAALELRRPGFRAYNVTRDAGPALTLREFMQAFADAAGVRIRVVRLPLPLARWMLGIWSGRRLARAALAFMTGDDPYVTELAEAELNWRPTVATRTGIARTVRWVMENEKPG